MLKKIQTLFVAFAIISSFVSTAVAARITWSNLPGLEGAKLNFHTDTRKFDGGDFKDFEIVTIPEIINNVPVEIIERDTFFNEDKLVSITLPATVKEFGNNAFGGMENLKEVIIQSPAVVFNGTNFGKCPNLEKVVFHGADVVVEGMYPSMFEESPNVVVYGKAGSSVEAMAKKYNVKFSPL